jgi:hypothetical protein
VAIVGRVGHGLEYFLRFQTDVGQLSLSLRGGLADEVGGYGRHLLAVRNVERDYGVPWFRVAPRWRTVGHQPGFDRGTGDGDDLVPHPEMVGLQLGASLSRVQSLKVGHDRGGQAH